MIQLYTIILMEKETNETLEFTSHNTGITVSPLHPYYSYECQVRAETFLPGPYSDSIVVQLDEDGMLKKQQQSNNNKIQKHSYVAIMKVHAQ